MNESEVVFGRGPSTSKHNGCNDGSSTQIYKDAPPEIPCSPDVNFPVEPAPKSVPDRGCLLRE